MWLPYSKHLYEVRSIVTELLERFIARKLFRWLDKQYDQKYWGRLERNRKKWKRERRTLEEDEDEIDNMVDPYYEL